MRKNAGILGIVLVVLVLGCTQRGGGAAGPAAGEAASAKPRPNSAQSSGPQAEPGKTQAKERTEAVPSSLPPDLLLQWSRFQKALRTDDTALLAEVTRFPLKSNEFGGDIRSAEILKKRYATIFPDKTKQCLLASALKREEYEGKAYYEVYCDVGAYPIRFLFEPVGSSFLFTGIDNINE